MQAFFDEYRYVLGGMLLVMLIIWKLWPTLSPLLKLPSGDQDAQDLAAFRRLKKRVTSEEGRDALKLVWKELEGDA